MADKPANLGEHAMSQDTISRLILDQLKSLREDMKEGFREVNEDIRNIREDVGEIKDEIASRDGIRSRLTALELKTQQAIESVTSGPASSYPVSSKKKGIKEHAPAVGAGMGVTGLLYGLIEVANAYLKTK